MTKEEARNEIDYLINDGVVTEKIIVPLEQRSIDALKVAKEALQERPKGRWIFEDIDYFRCSECGSYEVDKTNYCPNCGADCRESEE
jgi:hypothetical protein